MAKTSEFEIHVARLWEILETKIMRRRGFYHRVISSLVDERYLNKDQKILCAATGPGTLYSVLLEQGYDVYPNDGSPAMLERLDHNIKDMGLKHKHKPTNYRWQELSEHYAPETFDFIFTEGNSLIYASSWRKCPFNLEASLEAIEESVKNKSKILKQEGIWYVDIPKKSEERTYYRRLLTVDDEPIDFECIMQNNRKQRVRLFSMKESGKGFSTSVDLKGAYITYGDLFGIALPKYFEGFGFALSDPHYCICLLRKITNFK